MSNPDETSLKIYFNKRISRSPTPQNYFSQSQINLMNFHQQVLNQSTI